MAFPHRRLLAIIASLALGATLFASRALMAEAQPLVHTGGSHSLTTAAEYFVDKSATMDLAEVRALPAGAWKQTNDEYLNLGTNASVGWLRIRLRNAADPEQQPLLIWEYPWGDRTDVFLIDSNQGPEGVERDMLGIDAPIAERAYRHRIPVVRLAAPPGLERLLYLRIESSGTKVARFYIESEAEFLRRDQRHAFVFYFFLGALLFMLALNALLAYSSRSTGPLFYALALLFYALNVALFRDYLTEIFFPHSPEWKYRCTYIFTPMMGIALIAFWRWLLLLRVHAPRIDRALLVVIVALFSVAGLALLPEPDFLFLNHYGKFIFYIEALLLIAGAVQAMRRRFYPAFYSVSGFIFLQGGIAVYLLATSDVLPMNAWTEHALLLGFAPEFAFFMFSLFSRTRLLQSAHPEGGQASEAEQIAAYTERVARDQQKYIKSKILNVDAEAIQTELEALMSDEKLFCDEDLSLQRLADMLKITPYQLSEIINASYQKNFFRYINEYRVAEARVQLRSHRDRPIAAIARSVGFHSLSSFNSEFKRIAGTTPSKYRRDTKPF
ncbi:MAG: helix-turn-helix domain-containing protein [bacterium]|nr:helix-turn-helix domain-containing protein [bacterium]